MRRLGAALLMMVSIAACQSNRSSPPATPAPAYHALLVFTTWTPDPKVTNGPEPGYKPALTGLTGHDVERATPVIDATGAAWIVNIAFTAHGSDLFSKLTRDNVSACLTCPQRHLAIWVELTQADIDSWEDPAYVAKVSARFDLACLAQSRACPKLVSDPVTLQEIDTGSVGVSGDFTQRSATELAQAITSPPA